MTRLYAMLGPVRVERMSAPDAVGMIERARFGAGALRIGFCNAHTLLTALDRPDYAVTLSRLVLLNDGLGASIAARMLEGQGFAENLNGTDLIPLLLATARPGLRVFLLGARPEVVAEAATRLAADYPGHRIVGARDGYFDPSETAALVEAIGAAQPDLLLVAMGNPLQEEFIVRHGPDLPVPVIIGVGALFDFLAGAVPRAPRLVRRLRCEWLFRLLVEPRRLGRRYTIGILRLLWLLLRLRGRRGSARAAEPIGPVETSRREERGRGNGPGPAGSGLLREDPRLNPRPRLSPRSAAHKRRARPRA